MKPRPSFASTLLTAEPTARLVWWAETVYLEHRFMTRLKWLVETSGGLAWLVIDPNEEGSLSVGAVGAAATGVGLCVGEALALGRGETAIPVTSG